MSEKVWLWYDDDDNDFEWQYNTNIPPPTNTGDTSYASYARLDKFIINWFDPITAGTNSSDRILITKAAQVFSLAQRAFV